MKMIKKILSEIDIVQLMYYLGILFFISLLILNVEVDDMNMKNVGKVTKITYFECAHKLKKSYNKDCMENIHGHSYKLEVSVAGELNEDGMVIDFKLLNEIIKEKIVDVYDHALVLHKDDPLVQSVDGKVRKLVIWEKNSTAELMAKEFYQIFYQHFVYADKRNLKIRIKLWETTNSYAEYGDDI